MYRLEEITNLNPTPKTGLCYPKLNVKENIIEQSKHINVICIYTYININRVGDGSYIYDQKPTETQNDRGESRILCNMQTELGFYRVLHLSAICRQGT